jgi:hypothetical protein
MSIRKNIGLVSRVAVGATLVLSLVGCGMTIKPNKDNINRAAWNTLHGNNGQQIIYPSPSGPQHQGPYHPAALNNGSGQHPYDFDRDGVLSQAEINIMRMDLRNKNSHQNHRNYNHTPKYNSEGNEVFK